jgi:DNA-binding NarL/FixJ family response regulator
VSQEVVKYAVQHVSKPVKQVPPDRLSAKGVEVLSLAAKGLSNKEIGSKLGITEATVKSYFVDVFQKLNVRSRTEAIFVGLKSGLLTLDDLN